jgi:hypothetical protein
MDKEQQDDVKPDELIVLIEEYIAADATEIVITKDGENWTVVATVPPAGGG